MDKKTNEVLLEIKGLQKKYDEITVLEDINLCIKKGEVVVILGPSGCGKSTLLRCINGLEKIQGGDIRFCNKSLVDKDVNWQETRQHIGMVFQNYDLFPHMTVIENIILGPVKVQKRNKSEVMEQARQLLDRVGLYDRKDSYPRQLSGGQKQRIAIVRALCMNPEIMLFDEVTASLDPEMVREVLDVILGLAKQGMTMVIVTHEMSFARAVADRIVFIDKGRICEISEPHEFFAHPKTERAQHFLNKFQY
ncbi:glutamine ABC transporter ATP-binding protein [Clostridium thermosuccinogenes]|uniref:Glutamine ABC transporter ATP-binding protein n=1 Tax=Clostridium thermosuccinogenes TaxID=84032 RepID=A0A2K2F8X5_9CLOT|nr:amino acid ABC transporter ATP-binding protein [Pseudoclostridium thermosuccinogenes]AUS97399.1 glutamine ABC transporter ATP-binding protein [Pseudoclostridium thermosuccinogenes]PNT95233.1 glutamine ABC transporter ATP-binding protein [Pseudoclostridium thermosuccinogenes]PNT96145.1 glutamine ABC transporter ATP-binding protein [Pseudoclostridium thermosuccinogenes]